MGGASGRKSGSNLAPGSQPRGFMTLREESTGKKHGNVNAKTMCKIDHLKDLALWAAVEASVPPLGAFFGERLAATNEALGLRGDPLFFACERCESILQPGNNCSVRIEKNRSKGMRRQKRLNPTVQNYVVYRCHFCSHRNLVRGTSKGYVKEICPQKLNPTSNVKKDRENHHGLGNATVTTTNAFLPNGGQSVEASSPATPLPTTSLSLLDAKRRKRNRSGAKKVVKPAADLEKSIRASSKRRKKSWTSLKEIAETNGQDVGKKLKDLTVSLFF